MKRAVALLSASIVDFRRRPPGTSCAGSGCRLPQTRLRLRSRRAAGIILMLLCCGCGPKQAAPLILNLPDCPAPSVPTLPELDGAEPLDSPENLSRLLERDDGIRAYIDGLKSALQCEQARGNHGK